MTIILEPAAQDPAAAARSDLRLRAERLAAALPPLMMGTRRVAATFVPGAHGLRRAGAGDQFWQFRPYQMGDPAHLIDWRRSAGSTDVFVREKEKEAAQAVWLWRDGSASMRYRSGAGLPTKLDCANLLLLALVSLLVRARELVGLVGADRRATTGRATLERILSVISAHDDAAAGEELPPAIPPARHSHIVWIGDFLGPLSELEARVRLLAGHRVSGHLLQLLDPAELELPFDGRVRFEGPEGEGDFTVGRVQSLRPAYQTRLSERHAALAALARASGWTFARHRTDQTAQAALLALYAALGQMGPI